MGQAAQALQIVDSAISDGVIRGIVLLDAEDERLDGRSVRVRGESRINFASCSYLGLELDPRLKQGAIDALERYGTQFSSSRTYISAPLYEEVEALLSQITGGHALVTPNTTLGHLSTLPVVIGEDDAAILDHQVHQTVQLTAPILRSQGTRIELARHDDIAQLDERISELKQKHRKVWYLADGIYSMYGDPAPVKALSWLLMRHEQLHLYIDDAHGMSWCGRNGRGFALENLGLHDRVIVAVSLNKAFAASGGAIVFPTEELRRRVRVCGGPMIFTGPIQPPMLGAIVASARIHLSGEIDRLQEDLLERIRFTNQTAAELDLPLVNRAAVPIRYVGLGLPRTAHAMTQALLDRGFLANCAGFPAVPMKRAGLRFTLTLHHRMQDIRALLEAVAEQLPRALEEVGGARADIDRYFSLGAKGSAPAAGADRGPAGADSGAGSAASLMCRHATSIRSIDADEWNRCLGDRGSFSWEGLRFLETVFSEGEQPEDRWRFHYYVVRDRADRIVLATFFTEALWKDDLLAPGSISEAIEQRRTSDPYFLTSRLFAMGSLLTEGDHLYLDRSLDWKGALRLLLAAVTEAREGSDAASLVLRDLSESDPELDECLKVAGFVKIELPESMLIDVDWKDREGFLSRLSKRGRKFQRENVHPWDEAYELEILRSGGRSPSDEEWAHLYGLYRNVKQRNLALNTFPLPERLFRNMLEFPGWELLLLKLRAEFGGGTGRFCDGFMAAHCSGSVYVPILTGMNYRYVESHGLYRQLLARTVARAQERGAQRIHFGMGAELEKRRFGARQESRVMYVQSYDHFHHDVLTLITANPELEAKKAG